MQLQQAPQLKTPGAGPALDLRRGRELAGPRVAGQPVARGVCAGALGLDQGGETAI